MKGNYIGESILSRHTLLGNLHKSADNKHWYIIPKGEQFTDISPYEVDISAVSYVCMDVNDEIAEVLKEGVEYIRARAYVAYDEMTAGAHNPARYTDKARQLERKVNLCDTILKLIKE